MDINLNTSSVGAGNIALGQGNEVKIQDKTIKPILGGDNIGISAPIVDISKLIDTLKEENENVADSLKRRLMTLSLNQIIAANESDIKILTEIDIKIKELEALTESMQKTPEERRKLLEEKERLTIEQTALIKEKDEIEQSETADTARLDAIGARLSAIQQRMNAIDTEFKTSDTKFSEAEKQVSVLGKDIAHLETQLSDPTKRELGALFEELRLVEAPPEGKERLEDEEKAIVFAFLRIPTDQFDAVIRHLEGLRMEIQELQDLLNEIDTNRVNMI